MYINWHARSVAYTHTHMSAFAIILIVIVIVIIIMTITRRGRLSSPGSSSGRPRSGSSGGPVHGPPENRPNRPRAWRRPKWLDLYTGFI